MALAEAFGVHGRRVETRSQVAEAVKEARASSEPFLLDFRVEQEFSVFPMVPAGASISDMLRRGEASAQ